MSITNAPNSETNTITTDVQNGSSYYCGFYGTTPIAQRAGAA